MACDCGNTPCTCGTTAGVGDGTKDWTDTGVVTGNDLGQNKSTDSARSAMDVLRKAADGSNRVPDPDPIGPEEDNMQRSAI